MCSGIPNQDGICTCKGMGSLDPTSRPPHSRTTSRFREIFCSQNQWGSTRPHQSNACYPSAFRSGICASHSSVQSCSVHSEIQPAPSQRSEYIHVPVLPCCGILLSQLPLSRRSSQSYSYGQRVHLTGRCGLYPFHQTPAVLGGGSS
jgi:hypothetical protein